MFDKVEWKYLYYVLSKFGFDSDFIAWIRLLFDSPTDDVLTNSVKSPPFALHWGTRQGCPLFPLLFALAVEPLATWFQGERRVKSIARNGVTHNLSFYVDNLLFYVSNTIAPIPVIISILFQFGRYFGYKLNFNKSKLLPLNRLASEIPPSPSAFPI